MSTKSIDGLQRRASGGDKKASRSRATTSSTMMRRTTKTTTKRLGLPDDEKELKKLVAESNKSDKLDNPKKKRKVLGVKKDDKEFDKENEAVKEFLSEVRDVDPTDLTELPEEEKAKKNKKHKKHGKKRHTGRWIALVVVVLLVGAGIFVYNYLNDFVSSVTGGGNIMNVIFSDPDTPLEKDENGRTNILIFGTEGYAMDDPRWDGGQLTDSMMMMSIDQETGDIKTVSLPRDLKAKTCTSTSKINEVYWCKYNKVKKNTPEDQKRQYEEEGAMALEAAFEEVFGVQIQYHIHANWAALTQIVDAIGGIDVVFLYGNQTWAGDETTIVTTSPKGLADGRPYHIQFPNGQVIHLNGEQALAVARARNAYGGYGASNGNFSREYFQQRVIDAIVKKSRNVDINLGMVLQVKSAIGDNLRTNFKDTEIKTIVKLATKLDFSGVQTISLYDTKDKPRALLTTGMINGISYVYPTQGVGQYSNIHAYIKRKLSGEAFTSEEANVVVLNGTAVSGIAANEKTYLEGKGYIVSATANAPSDLKDFDGVKVYQVSAKKPKTAEALSKLYGVQAEVNLPESLSAYSNVDFVVIIGNGFSHDAK